MRPSIISGPMRRSKNEGMLDQMHSALHSLGSQMREQEQSEGDKLLPSTVKPKANPTRKAALKHIETLHKAFKSVKGGKR